MGKRIPGKKHKGVKDPLLQIAKREDSLKNQINAPPKDVDFQEIPKSVVRLMKLKELAKSGVLSKPKHRKKGKNKNILLDTSKLIDKEKILPGMSKPDRNLPTLIQKPGESNGAFLHRVRHATDDFVKEVNFEVKNNMKMKRDEKTGQVKFDKIEMDPVEKMFKDKLLAQNKNVKKKRKSQITVDENLSKTAKRRLKQQARRKELNKLEGDPGDEDEFKKFQDKVEFNEVVHRPPELRTLPRKASDQENGFARRPGSKPGLLLAQMLAQSAQPRSLTGRRRDMSARDRQRLDSAQTAAIQAYRQLKAARATGTAVT